MPKKVLIALPPGLLQETDDLAAKEHRTRSDFIREAIRQYIKNYHREQVQKTQPQFFTTQPALTAVQ